MSRAVFLDLAYRDGRGFGCPLPDNGGAKGLGSGDGFRLPMLPNSGMVRAWDV